MGAVTANILPVDDEPQVHSILSKLPAGFGLHGQTSSDPRQVSHLLTQGQFDVVIADIARPQANGLELLVRVKRHSPSCEVILITAGDLGGLRELHERVCPGREDNRK